MNANHITLYDDSSFFMYLISIPTNTNINMAYPIMYAM